MKKILATILALVMALGLCSVSWAADGEATVSSKEELEQALNGSSVTTIKLGAEITASITIASGKTITLDLNGHKLTSEAGKHTITNNGTLTIKDSSEGKTGTVDNVTHQRAAIVNNGTATLNGGTYTRSNENPENNAEDAGGNSFYTILSDNGATMTINEGVTVTNVGHFSSMIRNGGTSASTSTMIINGGTFNGGLNAIKNDEAGVLTINGGDFSNTSQFVVMNWHKTTINGGSFKAQPSAEAVLFTAKYAENTAVGELTIINGTFERSSDTQKMIRDYYDEDNKGTAAISGGAFKDAAGKAVDVSAYLVAGKQQNSDGSVGNKSYYYYSPSTTTPDTTTKGSPKTFDAGVGIYAVTAVLSVTGMAWTAKKRH